jgi:hypothetical protein
VHEQVRVYAVAHGVTVYEATERLVVIGLDGAVKPQKPELDSSLHSMVAQITAKTDLLTALTDRALYTCVLAYAYARHAGLSALDGDQRQTLDNSIVQTAEGAYMRQRAKALGD